MLVGQIKEQSLLTALLKNEEQSVFSLSSAVIPKLESNRRYHNLANWPLATQLVVGTTRLAQSYWPLLNTQTPHVSFKRQ